MNKNKFCKVNFLELEESLEASTIEELQFKPISKFFKTISVLTIVHNLFDHVSREENYNQAVINKGELNKTKSYYLRRFYNDGHRIGRSLIIHTFFNFHFLEAYNKSEH